MKTKSIQFIFTVLLLVAFPTINFAQTPVLNQRVETVNIVSTSSQIASNNLSTTTSTRNGTLVIGKSTVLTIGKNATLVTNTNIDNIGSLVNEGSLILNGDTTQIFPGSTGTVSYMSKLEVNNTGAGVMLNQHLRIDKELKLTKGKLALGNYDVSIKSTASQTASVSAIGTGAGVEYGTGRFIVERFINLGNGGHNKSWQFLSVPANGQSIKNTWQEAGAASVGYGTQISSPYGVAGGFDVYSSTPSIKSYVSATNSYDLGPSSTSALVDNPKGYMLFVRGDRTVSLGNGTTPTTLRIKGTIFTPNNPPSTITVDSAKFESVGNPYASQINFTKLSLTGGVDSIFYTWDPSLVGFYGLGGYQTMSATNGWIPVPGGGNYTGVHKTIESGQAFYVHSSATAGSISFSEDVKTGSSKLLNRIYNTDSSEANQYIRNTLFTNTGLIADGNSAAFNSRYSNEIDGDDAIKIMNGGENFGINREGKILSIEARSHVSDIDTIFYFISRLRQQPYRFYIEPENMDQTKTAWLIDNFLQTNTLVSMSSPTDISFSVTSNPQSSATNRFMLVFQLQRVLAVTSTILQADRNTDVSINTNWKTAMENNIKSYTIERAKDDMIFNAIATKDIVANNGSTANYSFKDNNALEGINFYRVKINALNGEMTYSNVVKVEALKTKTFISLYPNPVSGRTLSLNFTGSASINYQAVVVNEVGQRIWTGSVYKDNSIGGKISLTLPKGIAAGNYVLLLYDKNGKSLSLPFILL